MSIHLLGVALMLGLVGNLILACHAPPEGDPFTADCKDWCGKRSVCGFVADPDEVVERCADSCVDALELGATKLGQPCVDAYEQAMECLAGIDCEEYASLTFIPGTSQPCAIVLDPYYGLCPGVFLAPDSALQEEKP